MKPESALTRINKDHNSAHDNLKVKYSLLLKSTWNVIEK